MEGKKKLWKIVFPLTGVVLIVGGILLFYYKIYRVEPAFSQVVYEYGEEVSVDIADYLVGTEWSVHLGELDLSGVDQAHIGSYEAFVYHGKHRYSYTITIKDTLPPVIHLKEEQIYLAVDEEYPVSHLIAGVEDTDVHAAAYVLQGGERENKVSFWDVGEYTIELVAHDCSGNESFKQLSVIVDTPPEILGIRAFYLAPGSEPDFKEQVKVWDDVDGDLTDELVLDVGQVELLKEGEYTLHYKVRDAYGLETIAETKVLVASADVLQAQIGKREINYLRDVIIGAPNVYDVGAAQEENIKDALADIRPTLVQLYHATGKGGYSSGSGYIIEITEDCVYICTNRHVVEKYEDWDIYFFDGTKVPGKMVGFSEGYDVGVAVVDRKDVPETLLRRLKTVHIDRTYWESLSSQQISLALQRVDRAGGLLHVTEGKLIETRQEFEWNDKLEHTEVTVELVHGDSGSAVVDGYGNLIGMAYAYSTEPVRYWCVPLDGILSCYREITGRVPYVY